MRDPKRIKKVLKHIERVWSKYPDLRLGQLLDNARLFSPTSPKVDMFYIEDNDLVSGVMTIENREK